MRKGLLVFIVFAIVLILAAMIWLPGIDRSQLDGELSLPALQHAVTVRRDGLGIPYIQADSLDDALTAQGFVTAQDRLFQLELFKYMAQGRLAELIGEKGLKNDRLMRLLDIRGLAHRQAGMLSDEERNYNQRYVDGIDAYIAGQEHEFPLVFRLMNHAPQPWDLTDILAIQLFRIWSSSVNWKDELLSQQLIDELGAEQATELAALSINPDDPSAPPTARAFTQLDLRLSEDFILESDQRARTAMGSNSWASGSRKSVNGMPILVNDPHIDARHLPGFWYPVGLFTPQVRAIGGGTPGVPGIGIGRTGHIAWGATNGYGDMVDLYIEQLDPDRPDHYLEGERSLPFLQHEETIRIKDREAEGGYREEVITIRRTRRGPVISDHGMTLVKGKVISLRWSVPEFLGRATGQKALLEARSVAEARAAIALTPVPLNYIVVDDQGSIARISSGYVPLRLRGDGRAPMPATAQDNWDGRIPADEMPAVVNPDRDWVGSANHRVLPADYPYAYSSHFSHSWRYRRLLELFTQEKVSTADHWRFLLDGKNMMAVAWLPTMIDALRTDTQTAPLAEILAAWDAVDRKEQAAPLIYQTVIRHFVRRMFSDEMGEELVERYLYEYYYWHERVTKLVLEGDSHWFDDIDTPAVETRDDLFRLAAADTLAELGKRFGDDPRQWRWGDAHTVTFFHPIFPGERAARWLGGGVHPMDGSGETLNRALFAFDDPQNVRIIPSLRLVADLSDPDKVEAHFPGGVSERLFSPYGKNQLPLWLEGKPGSWWFSDQAIEAHTEHVLILEPGSGRPAP